MNKKTLEGWDKAWEKHKGDVTSGWYFIVPSTKGMHLDIGCGNLKFFDLSTIEYVVGIDISKNALKEAKQTKKEDKQKYDLVQASADYLPFKNRSFNQVSMIETLTLMGDDYEKVLNETSRVTKDRFVFTATHKDSVNPSTDISEEAKERINFMKTYDIRKKGFTKIEIENLLKKVGFEIENLDVLTEGQCDEMFGPSYDSDYDPPHVEVSDNKKSRIIANARKANREN